MGGRGGGREGNSRIIKTERDHGGGGGVRDFKPSAKDRKYFRER